METALLILAIILLGLGLLGTFLPVLPGPPLAWAGLLCEYFIPYSTISIPVLTITFITAVIITILDFAFPVIQTKKSGGTKYGTWGSTIGLIVGLFSGPFGILVGPFIGAFIGELIHDSSDYHKALRSAWASFIGFLSGTLMKIVTVSVFIIIFILRLK
ncbi:DUF456 domain-containing protein [Treponema sp.]|uniref:DUF456 domain-containing protein n=1 Tax=Treponema sp. TaxID=166 RepID=UPI0038900F49